jgi:O-antigen/teichoic acid export membrane protein
LKIYKKLAGQTIVYGMGTVVPRLLNYGILTVYYTRLFEIEQFGVITELYAYVTFLMVILTFGTETGYFKFAGDENRDSVFSSVAVFLLFTSVLFSVLLFVGYKGVADWLDYTGNPEYISLMGAIVAIDAFSTIGFAKLRKEERSLKFSALKIINVLMTIVFVIFFYEVLPELIQVLPESFLISLRSDVSYVLLSNLLASTIVFLLLVPEYLVKRFKPDFQLLKEILLYSIPLLIGGLAGVVNETLDRVLLKHLIKDNAEAMHALGIYGANYRIAVLLFIVIQMFRFAVEPFYFNYYKQPDDKIVFSQILRLFMGVCIAISMFILFYLDYLKFFIDPKFHEGLSVVPVVLFAYILYGVFLNLSIWYKLTRLTIFAIVLTGIGAGITVAMNILFVPRFSYMAAAYGHLISYFVMVLLSYFMGQHFYKIDYKVKKIFEFLLVALSIFVLEKSTEYINQVAGDIIRALLIIGYLLYIAYRENLLNRFLSRNEN